MEKSLEIIYIKDNRTREERQICFGEGEWLDEPDSAFWVDEDFSVAIVRLYNEEEPQYSGCFYTQIIIGKPFPNLRKYAKFIGHFGRKIDIFYGDKLEPTRISIFYNQDGDLIPGLVKDDPDFANGTAYKGIDCVIKETIEIIDVVRLLRSSSRVRKDFNEMARLPKK